MKPDPDIRLLPPTAHDEALEVLCQAFAGYPVMNWVLGPDPEPERLRLLTGFFLAARALREEPVFGLRQQGNLLGVAIVTLPGERPAPPALLNRREETWAKLGPEARSRYEAYGAACRTFHVPEPHHHLNMIGVRPGSAGKGLGRRLLEAVSLFVAADPGSAGVSLDTERADNVRLYEHCGWRVIGHARVAPELESWGMLRVRSER